MANAFYNPFLAGLQNKEVDMDTDTIKATLTDGADYTFSAAHTSYATDVAAGGKVAVATLTSPAISAGNFDSADFTWTAVTGDQSEIILLWDDTHASDLLVAYYDTGMTGMPVTPSGGDINVTVNASGWYTL